MEIVFDHVDFAYENFLRRGSKRNPPHEDNSDVESIFALHDISFSVTGSECVAILGRSGSGKSTLLSLFTGLARPSRGTILIDGRNLADDAVQLSAIRRRIGLVFQFPESQLFETTIYDDVAYGPRNLGVAEPMIQGIVEQSLEAVGLPMREFGRLDPLRLSQGEKRRAAIAGILAMQPEMLIMDEPNSGLDAAGRTLLIGILRELRERRIGLIIISHDTSLAMSLAQRALVLDMGKCCYDGELLALLQNDDLAHQFGLEIPRRLRLSKKLLQRGFSLADSQQLFDQE